MNSELGFYVDLPYWTGTFLDYDSGHYYKTDSNGLVNNEFSHFALCMVMVILSPTRQW